MYYMGKILFLQGAEELDCNKMDELCADRKVLFNMDFGKINRYAFFWKNIYFGQVSEGIAKIPITAEMM